MAAEAAQPNQEIMSKKAYKISSVLTNKPTQPVAKPAPLDNVTDDSGDIPLEASNRRIYWIGFFLLIIVFVSTFVFFYLRTKLTINEEDSPNPPTSVSTQEVVYP